MTGILTIGLMAFGALFLGALVAGTSSPFNKWRPDGDDTVRKAIEAKTKEEAYDEKIRY
jgi:hypothetical protein